MDWLVDSDGGIPPLNQRQNTRKEVVNFREKDLSNNVFLSIWKGGEYR